jgi:hypothetical protein
MSIGQEKNPYRHTGVQPLDLLIEKKGCILTWWAQNLQTKFFRNKHTASLVRRAVDGSAIKEATADTPDARSLDGFARLVEVCNAAYNGNKDPGGLGPIGGEDCIPGEG